jgi:hypothetical protein
MSHIRVTIDELALKGFAPAHRKALVEGLRAELARVLADPASQAGWSPRNVPALRLGRIAMEPGDAGSRKLGAAVARRISVGVKR